MDWYIKVLKQYADFKGRASRKEYWMFILFNTIFLIVAIILDNVLGITFGRDIFYGPIYSLYVLAVFIPGLAVSVRRLHDIGKSGWYYLVILIPIAGPIWFLILMVTESNKGENQYDLIKTDHQLVDSNKHDESLISIVNNSASRDTVVLAVIVWMFLVRMFWFSIPKLLEKLNVIIYETAWFKPLDLFMGLIWALVPIVLALVVKDKTKQLIVLIMGAIYLVVSLTDTIIRFTR